MSSDEGNPNFPPVLQSVFRLEQQYSFDSLTCVVKAPGLNVDCDELYVYNIAPVIME